MLTGWEKPVMPCPPALKASGRIRELDGWRAISVMCVIFHHLFSIQHPGWILRWHFVWHIAGLIGFFGVDTFFVISGFVISRLLLLEEKRNGAISLKGLYCRRIFRIIPPLYFYLGFMCLLVVFGCIEARWASLLVASSFLGDLNIFPRSWFVDHMWSLSVEEQFYLIVPTIWFVSRRTGRRVIFFLLLIVCVVWSISLAFSGEPSPVFDARTRVGFTCICFGVIAALNEKMFRKCASRFPGWIIFLIASALVVHPVPRGIVNEALYSTLFMPPAIAVVIFYTLEREGYFREVLCLRPVQLMGIASYGIYLWQQLFTGPLVVYERAGKSAYFFPFLVCLAVPASYLWIELPAMRLGKRLSQAMTRQPELESATR